LASAETDMKEFFLRFPSRNARGTKGTCTINMKIVGFMLIMLIPFHIFLDATVSSQDTLARAIFTPDVVFPCRGESCRSLSHAGEVVIGQSKVVIAGLVRNRALGIPKLMERVELIGSQFQDYTVLVVENDSADDTRKLLLQWADNNPKVLILGCGVNAEKCELNWPETIGHPKDHARIEKMATLRNIYMDYISQLQGSYDYLTVWDFDLDGSLYLDGLQNGLYHFSQTDPKEMEGMCAYGVMLDKHWGQWTYFDPFAHFELKQTSYPFEINSLSDLKVTWDMSSAQRGDPLKKVRSCFGGFAIYRMEAIRNRRYGYSKPEEEVLCEHIFFHDNMAMYFNPSMILAVHRNDA